MSPWLIPWPPFVPAGSPDLAVRVQQLESALALSLGVLQTLLERLESKLGPGFLGEELGPLAASGGPATREQAGRIDALVQQGQQPKAAHLFRELAGVTWDQAHDVIGRWGAYPFDQKVRWLQVALWVKALGARPPGAGAQPEQG